MSPLTTKQYIAICAACLFSSISFGGEIILSHVTDKEGVYSATLEMQIKAPAEKVYALLTDFDYLTRLSDNITDSDVIEEDAPEYIVEIKTHNCVLFFCKDLQQTQQVLLLDDGHISVEDIKGQSDFIFAAARWHIRPHKKGTRVTFSSEMKPDFWLPPLLGPWLFKQSLIEETRLMINRLEQLAVDDK